MQEHALPEKVRDPEFAIRGFYLILSAGVRDMIAKSRNFS
jgi:hypothetical protein